jgi:hypothetical protein
MRVKGSDIEYHINYFARAIHVLDLNKGGKSLTNCIDPTYQQALVEQEGLLTDVLGFDWFCYGTDGTIAIYKNYNFNLVPDYTVLHQPYIQQMMKRNPF